jgi:hypothetical protein
MTDFDPVSLAEHCRSEGLYLGVDRPAAEFDASDRARIAAFDLEGIVSAWLVGEARRFQPALVRTASWLAAADAELGDGDSEGLFGVVRRRRALETARWLLGVDGRSAAAEAASAGAARLTQRPRLGPHELAEHLCDWLLAGDPAGAIAAAAAYPPDPADIEAAMALRLAAAGNAADDRDVLAAAGQMLALQLESWLYNGAFVRIANWTRLIFVDSGIAGDAESGLLAVYAFLDGVGVPPALAKRGWRGSADSAVVALPDASLRRVDRLAVVLGLRRDADAVPQDPAAPTFSSWTAPRPDDREIDWHDADGRQWLEVRGRAAGVLAGVLATALSGRVTDDPARALAAVLTVPRHHSALEANGAMRWATLRAAVATAAPETMPLVTTLVRAGLRDPDWRVCMTAMLAVGKLRLAALAEGAMAVKVPPAGESGLGSEDRRALLALRQAAHDRALGLPPSTGPGEGMPADIAAKRRAHQQHLHALLADAAVKVAVTDTAALIMAALLESGQLRNPIYPGRWRAWLDRPHG